MFAALNSVEPHVQNLTTIDLFFANEEWAKAAAPGAEKMAQSRLDAVAASLEGRDYLEGEFTAGDLMMVTVLRFLRHTSLVSRHAGARRLPGALRGAARVSACAGGAAGALREERADRGVIAKSERRADEEVPRRQLAGQPIAEAQPRRVETPDLERGRVLNVKPNSACSGSLRVGHRRGRRIEDDVEDRRTGRTRARARAIVQPMPRVRSKPWRRRTN